MSDLSKRVLGLDLGTTSIGWALVEENQANQAESKIVKLGVRVNPLSADEQNDFEKGNPITTNADRTAKRGARRRLQRFKLRREKLINIFLKNGFISQETQLTEIGNHTTHQTLEYRAKSAREKVSLEQLAKVILHINRGRGYKSNRKTKSAESDGVAIDSIGISKILDEQNITPGQYAYSVLKSGSKMITDFYTSDLQAEFDKIWNFQKQFYSDILTDDLKIELAGKNKSQTWAICKTPFKIQGIKRQTKGLELNKENYKWRCEALREKINLEQLAVVLQEINAQLNKADGYLGKISDRSKILYLNKQTIGEYLYNQIKSDQQDDSKSKTDSYTRIRDKVFYRQDYWDEFEQIWKTQAKFYPQLTDKLKKQIGEETVFYQRRLKSQKGSLSFCEFESWEQKCLKKSNDGTEKETTIRVGSRVLTKASLLFQEFKIWQDINKSFIKNKQTNEEIEFADLDDDTRKAIFDHLNIEEKISSKGILNILKKYINLGKVDDWECNFKEIKGNITNSKLYKVYEKILQNEGYGSVWNKKSPAEKKAELVSVFKEIGINPAILDFKATLEGGDFYKQPSYQLWHLLYSAEDDVKISPEDREIYGNNDVALKKILHKRYGFEPAYAALLANISLSDDYGNLSAKAIRKIIPYLQQGELYSHACESAGYNHSHSLNKEELAKQEPERRLELLKKNSLRNPVVEKILNQMVNVINQVVNTYDDKPIEKIRIEMARDLKNSAKVRKEIESSIRKNTRINDEIKEIIDRDFGFTPTKSDVEKYKLWEELETRGNHQSLYTDTPIPIEKLFTKELQIEHIIPKALYYDNSFSNKTLAYHEVNLKKGNRTALDFISKDHFSDLESYKARVKNLYDEKKISKNKYENLLLSAKDLEDKKKFTNRDLGNTRYITKFAKQMLEKAFGKGNVVVVNSGEITKTLREDWNLINVMEELNISQYEKVGFVETETRKYGKQKKVIKLPTKNGEKRNWNKRDDHRHHAMDALTVAFTTRRHIQYLNYKHGRGDNYKPKAIDNKNPIIEKDKFIPPMSSRESFRKEAKKHIESILVSFKGKNKVVTKNINRTKGKKGYNSKEELTPRGSLHKETVYGKIKRIVFEPKKISTRFTLEQANLIVDNAKKQLVLAHLQLFDNNPKVAFASKTLKKHPLVFKEKPLEEVHIFEQIYTIRKEVGPDLKVEKVIDPKIRSILWERLAKFNNGIKESTKESTKKAFSDLDKNPIWLNKEKGIAIKRVTIKGMSDTQPLHYKKDHLGNFILDKDGKKQDVDFISTGNNHHVAIYQDEKGKLQEKMVSFYQAVIRSNSGLDVIDKNYNQDLGWKFLFTMKQNELFVFPSEDFNPSEKEVDYFLDENNASSISKHLFRVQKISTNDYWFRHHLETTVEDIKVLRDEKWKRIGKNGIKDIIKVRVNHTGKIVHIGE